MGNQLSTTDVYALVLDMRTHRQGTKGCDRSTGVPLSSSHATLCSALPPPMAATDSTLRGANAASLAMPASSRLSVSPAIWAMAAGVLHVWRGSTACTARSRWVAQNWLAPSPPCPS